MEGAPEVGRVRWFDARRGYGFIAREGGGDLFVHFAAIRVAGYRLLQPGMLVCFRVSAGPRGAAACDVHPLPHRQRSGAPPHGRTLQRRRDRSVYDE